MIFIKNLMLLSVMAMLVACGSDPIKPIFEEIKANYSAAESALSSLNNQLDSGTGRNAILIKSYASLAREKKPQFKEIIDVFESEATKEGPTYKQIVGRLTHAKTQVSQKPRTEEEGISTNVELLNIRSAISNYDAMLVDALNVLSDFTDGELPKVREIEFADYQSEKGEVGSEYVGNSSYGQWKTDTNGNSFWHWYGQYAFFSHMFRSPYYYDNWSYNRRPSYHHDRSQGVYTSPDSRKNNTDALSRTKKTYSAKGKSFKSPYAKNTKIKGVSGSTQKSSTKKVYKSSYSKPRSSSSSSSKSSSKKSSYNSRSSGSSRSSYGCMFGFCYPGSFCTC